MSGLEIAAQPGLLVVAERVPPARGGLAVATHRIAAAAQARGERVHLLYPSKELEAGTRGRVEIDGLVGHPVGVPEGQGLEALAEHARDVVELHRLDLLHGIYATRAGYVAALVGARLDLPSVVSIRGNDLDKSVYRIEQALLLELAVRSATRVTAVSGEGARIARRLFGRAVEHVGNAVDATRFSPAGFDNSLAAVLDIAPEPRPAVLGFVGELRAKKGMAPLLTAFAELHRRRPARLLLIGGMRADAEAAWGRFVEAEPDAAAHVQLIPYARDPERLARLYGLCDLVLFPSLADGTPNALLEVMAAGGLTLSTRVGGAPDVVEHGRSGFLLDRIRLPELAEALEEALSLPEAERRAMGKAARARVMEVATPEAESAAYARIYAEARAAAHAS